MVDNSKETKGDNILIGKIIAVFGRNIKLFYQGKEYDAIVRGRLLKEYLSSSPVAVGDNVEFSMNADGQSIIENVLSRKQYLAKPDLLVKNKIQIIASNLDQLVIVSSVQEPRFKPGLIDRFLVSAECEKLEAIIVINKIDLASRDEFNVYVDAWNSLGYQTIFTSAKTGHGLNELKLLLKAKSSVLAGHSGVGKTSLINAVQPSLNLNTSEISISTGKGVHTTASVVMFPLDLGGWIADTPGIKVFGLTGINRTNLYQNFPEMAKLEGECKFNNCLHISEPGCAVKKAVKSGDICEFRYLSYKRIFEKLIN